MTTTVRSLCEFISEICRAQNSLHPRSAEYHEILLFRGQSDKEYKLLPSIGRKRSVAAQYSILDAERNLIETAKYKMPEIFRRDMSPIELLALLQHHGIPTRLLDVTENALVALYFSCCNRENDGEVIVFKYNETDVAEYPIINAIADSYRFAFGSFTSLSSFYDSVKEQPYFVEQINSIKSFKTSEQGGEWVRECCKKPLFVQAPNRSLRQVMQSGRYILFPNKIPDYNAEETEGHNPVFDKIIEPIEKTDECIVKNIIIPQECKEKIISDLKPFGISQETLFADSTDKVCESIAKRFQLH